MKSLFGFAALGLWIFGIYGLYVTLRQSEPLTIRAATLSERLPDETWIRITEASVGWLNSATDRSRDGNKVVAVYIQLEALVNGKYEPVPAILKFTDPDTLNLYSLILSKAQSELRTEVLENMEEQLFAKFREKAETRSFKGISMHGILRDSKTDDNLRTEFPLLPEKYLLIHVDEKPSLYPSIAQICSGFLLLLVGGGLSKFWDLMTKKKLPPPLPQPFQKG